MDRKKAKALATHLIEYQTDKLKLKEKYPEDYETRKENFIRETTEALREYNFPSEEHETIIPHLSDAVKRETLFTFVGKTLILYDHMKAETNAWCFGVAPEGYYDMYPIVTAVRTESFGKKEDSIVYILTLSWEGKEFDYMCGLFSHLLELKIKE